MRATKHFFGGYIVLQGKPHVNIHVPKGMAKRPWAEWAW